MSKPHLGGCAAAPGVFMCLTVPKVLHILVSDLILGFNSR